MSDLKNSCDGCCAGMPIKNGIHINAKALTSFGRNHMCCTAHLYGYGDKIAVTDLPVFKLNKGVSK